MTPGENDIYTGVIPPQNSSTVNYYIEAYDFAGNLAVAKNAGQALAYGSVTKIVLAIAAIFTMTFLVYASIMLLRTTEKPHKKEDKSSIEWVPQTNRKD
jgi:hypothetical protein